MGLLRRHQRALQGLSGVALRSLWDLRAPDSDPSGSESVTPSGQVSSRPVPGQPFAQRVGSGHLKT